MTDFNPERTAREITGACEYEIECDRNRARDCWCPPCVLASDIVHRLREAHAAGVEEAAKVCAALRERSIPVDAVVAAAYDLAADEIRALRENSDDQG